MDWFIAASAFGWMRNPGLSFFEGKDFILTEFYTTWLSRLGAAVALFGENHRKPGT